TAFMLAVSKGGQWGWTAPLTIALGVGGALLVVLWVPWELRARNPLVDVRVAARPAVLLVNVVSLLTGFAMFVNMLVTTQLLQLPASTGYGFGLDVLEAGIWMAPTALVFGAMAPVAAGLIRRFGPQATLTVGAAIMAVAYGARTGLSDELWQVVLGSVLVAVGTSMTFAAMPTLIMRAVPVTETASANGLNTLLRSVGTTSSSAAMAAATSIGAVAIGGAVYPGFRSLMGVLWLAGGLSLVAALVSVPMHRMREFAEEREPTRDVRDRVVHGAVVSTTGRPVRNAVVSVLTPAGEQVDWSQVDSAGDFSVAVPGAGRYLVVVAAEGWAPHSLLADLDPSTTAPPIELTERLTLAGRVLCGGDGRPDAVVALTRQTGEVVATARSGPDGGYELPLPSNGRYVLTVVTPSGTTASRAVPVWGARRVVDVEVPDTPLPVGVARAAVVEGSPS
ncbi:MFS transporter, partial [Thalassiella azotivora]